MPNVIDDILSNDLSDVKVGTVQSGSTSTTSTHLDTKPSPVVGDSRFDLINNVFYCDNSGIETITACPYLAYVELLLRRSPEGDDSALVFGGHIHRAMDYRYNMMARCKSVRPETYNRLFDWCWSKQSTGDDWRSLGMACEIMRLYEQTYLMEPFEVVVDAKGPYVERPFAVHFGEYNGIDIIYMGKIDLKVCERGGIYIMDHKTSSVMGLGFWQSQIASEQQKGYAWVEREVTGVEPNGYIINSIATRKPTKTGTSVDFERRYFYTHYMGGRESNVLNEWKKNCFMQIRNFLRMIEDGTIRDEGAKYLDSHAFPKNHRHCVHKYGTCKLFDICNNNDNEHDRMKKIFGPGFKTNTWSPLSQVK